MTPNARFCVVVVVLLALLTVVGFAATQGYLPKYAADGSLIDSAIYETGGNVGIGTTAPAQKVHIVGGAQVDGTLHMKGALWFWTANMSNIAQIYSPTDEGGAYSPLQFSTGAGPAMRITNAGNVGIGTTTPAQKVHIVGDARVDGTLHMKSGALWLWTPTMSNLAQIYSPTDEGGAYSPLQFSTGAGPAMRITNAGNVGIGTTVPAARLHVAGDVRVDGNIAAKYQDVAEWVDSAEPIDAGTLVVIDDAAVNRVTAAAQPYDLRVVGAVSAQPGVVLGEPGRGKVLVAQSGRVRIKADARYGAIRAGDLLVSSPTKGAAMRSEPVDVAGVKMHRPGTLIGKALEALDHGTGTILVLLTLQ